MHVNVLHIMCFVLSQGECVVLDAFMSETFVAKLIGYLCLEEKKGSDHFSKSRMTVFVVRNCLNVVTCRTSCPSFIILWCNAMCGHCSQRGCMYYTSGCLIQ